MKLCPLMSYNSDNCNRIYCEEEGCGWWNEENKRCGVIKKRSDRNGKKNMAYK